MPTPFSLLWRSFWRRWARRPPTSSSGGRRATTPGGRGGQGGHRGLRAGDRQAGRAVFHPEAELPDTIVAALEAGQPPDFAFGFRLDQRSSEWAFDDRLVDLIGRRRRFLGPVRSGGARLGHAAQPEDGAEGSLRAADGRTTNHIHVWENLLEQAGFTLEDIPKEWEAFWSFWCDQVQPAVRRATGRDDLWGVGLPMSADAATPKWL